MKQFKVPRKSDIYISIVSWDLRCTPKTHVVATVSARIEGPKPLAQLKATAGQILGLKNIVKDFFDTRPLYEAVDQGAKNVYIPSSMDATTHFQRCTEEVQELYEKIMGKPIDLSAKPEAIGTD